jgi:hypothetical protein
VENEADNIVPAINKTLKKSRIQFFVIVIKKTHHVSIPTSQVRRLYLNSLQKQHGRQFKRNN